MKSCLSGIWKLKQLSSNNGIKALEAIGTIEMTRTTGTIETTETTETTSTAVTTRLLPFRLASRTHDQRSNKNPSSKICPGLDYSIDFWVIVFLAHEVGD